MITPNKVVTVAGSALGLAPIVLTQGPEPIGIAKLYQSVAKDFESIDQFLLVVDVLYVLGALQVNFRTGVVTYAR